jgi:hypothetical protein
VKSISTSPATAVTVRLSGTVPAGRAEDAGDDPPAIEAHGLRGRRGQVGRQLRELAERPRGAGLLNALGVLLRGKPPVARRLGEQRQHPVPVSVGRAQVAGGQAWAHAPNIVLRDVGHVRRRLYVTGQVVLPICP